MASLAWADDAATNAAPGVSAPDNPARTRAQELDRELVDLMGKNDTSQASWDAIDAKIDNYQKEFGVTPKTTHNVVLLRRTQLKMAKNLGDPARYEALIQKLAADPQPDVAALVQKLVDLKTKPLDLAFTAVDGSTVDLAKLRGKVVLVDFWATWCPPCRAEVPNVVATYQKYHDKGFEVVGISLDGNKDSLLAFTQANGMVWPQYFDGKLWENKISTAYNITSIPTMWLLDKKGMYVSEAGDDIAGQVEKLLAAP